MNGIAESLGGREIAFFAPSQARMDELGSWFESHYPALLRFAYFVSGDRVAAEDLVQEAFVKLYRAGARTDAAGIGMYARQTVANLAKSGYRRRSLESRAPASQPGTLDAHDVGARDEVWRAILGLSPKQRAVVALKFYEDMSERDIASTLGMSAGSVKKHGDRAMTKLRDILGRES